MGVIYQLSLSYYIIAALPDKHGLSHGMCLYQVMMTLRFCMTSPMTLNQYKNRKLRHNR